jgi:hypothetical protein
MKSFSIQVVTPFNCLQYAYFPADYIRLAPVFTAFINIPNFPNLFLGRQSVFASALKLRLTTTTTTNHLYNPHHHYNNTTIPILSPLRSLRCFALAPSSLGAGSPASASLPPLTPELPLSLTYTPSHDGSAPEIDQNREKRG